MATTLGERSLSDGNNLDFIRFALAASVCFTHSFNLLYGDNTDPLGVATGGAIGLGGTAVDMFFVISGFLVTKSWMASQGLVDFLVKRILRIYPAFLVVTLFCGLVFGPLGASNPRVYFAAFEPWKFLVAALRLDFPAIPWTLPSVPFRNLINGSLWTIKYEFLCYLLLAAFGLAGLYRFRAVILALFAGALAALLFGPLPVDSWFFSPVLGDVKVWPRFLAYFLAGMVAYLYRDRIPFSRWLFALSLIAMPLLILATGASHAAMTVFGAYAVLYVAYSRSLDVHGFGKYGDFSYGVYLYAFPIQQLLSAYYFDRLNGISMFVISLAITLAFAVASWRFVEGPSLRLKRRFVRSDANSCARVHPASPLA